MLELIKSMFSIGDKVLLHLEKSFCEGFIHSYFEDVVVLSDENGVVKSAVKGGAIVSFERVQTQTKTVNLMEAKDFPSSTVEPAAPIVDDEGLVKKEADPEFPITVNAEGNGYKSQIGNETFPIVIDARINKIDTIGERNDTGIADSNRLKMTVFEAGDKIPLDILSQRSPKPIGGKGDYGKREKRRYNSLSDLSSLIEPILQLEGDESLGHNGHIVRVFKQRGFGFIRTLNGKEIYFVLKNTVSKDLLDLMRLKSEIPVVFLLGRNAEGEAATWVHKPDKITVFAKYVEEFISRGFISKAKQLLQLIRDKNPESAIGTRLEELLNRNSHNWNSKPKGNLTGYYSRGKKAELKKEYQQALLLFKEALANGERVESCVKDVGMIYVQMGDFDLAKEFIKANEAKLTDGLTKYNFLHNFYTKVNDWEQALRFIARILEIIGVKDKTKRAFYLGKKGFALLQLRRVDEARKCLSEAKKLDPQSYSVARLVEAIESPDWDEKSKIISETEFDSYIDGVSRFIKDILDRYDKYHGVPGKVLESADFTDETLKNIRTLVKTAGQSRPRERANFLLTEAKLMQRLEPDEYKNFGLVLARYCSSAAISILQDGGYREVARSYYLEAFRMESSPRSLGRQIAVYLMSFVEDLSDFSAQNNISVDDALMFLCSTDLKTSVSVWEGILSMAISNERIFAMLVEKVFSNQILRHQSILFFQSVLGTREDALNIISYRAIWIAAKERRSRDLVRWIAAIKAIYSSDSLEAIAHQIESSLPIAKESWLSNLDARRMDIISKEISDGLKQYLIEPEYLNKEREFQNTKIQIKQMQADIRQNPTRLSYEEFIPLLSKIEVLIEKSFRDFSLASKSKVRINMLSDSCAVGEKNIVPFQIIVENLKGSAPISDVHVKIRESGLVHFRETGDDYAASINGGSNHVFRLAVKVDDSVLIDKATTLEVVCDYREIGSDIRESVEASVSLRLHSQEEFVFIENKYAPLADGGPIQEKGMFFGRDEFIASMSSALLGSDTKQFIIYGQKRSGKSSVLFHLKQYLQENGDAFCVSFSLGDIVENLSSGTFYHHILNMIEEELAFNLDKSEEIPSFKCPNVSEFLNDPNPAVRFSKCMREIKASFLKFPKWENRKLIIMIDEFTYLYSSIKLGKTDDSIMKQWKSVTQNERTKFSVVLVGQDVVPAFKNEEYAKNAFGVIQDERLTYLSKSEASKLIEKPIWDASNGGSRYIGNAVSTIIDYTACSPYYIQIFCARLVEFMNQRKIFKVTEADIKEVADSFVFGPQALTIDKFDNLLTAGEANESSGIDHSANISILRQIAVGARGIGYCPRDKISIGDLGLENIILADLVSREVVEKNQENYRIQVRLFQEWLIKNTSI